MTPPALHEGPRLRSVVSVLDCDGRLTARVVLRGELCAITAPQLRGELEQLIEDRIADITVDVRHLRLCTSHGLDLWDEIHHRLQASDRGTLNVALDGAPEVVRQVVVGVRDVDPTFSPVIVDGPPPHGDGQPSGACR